MQSTAIISLIRGVAKSGLKEYAAALTDFDAAVKLNPSDFEAYLERAKSKILFKRVRGRNKRC